MSAYPNVKFMTSADAARQFPPDQGSEVAIAGRSNAGKSSALNAVVGRKGLARTSRTPGATRLINFFELDPGRRLVDLPGYGFAAVPGELRQHWGDLVDTYFGARASLKGVIVVMDVRHPLTSHDRSMLELALGHGLPLHLLLTKSDKLGRGAARAALNAVQRDLEGSATVQLFSALSGEGLNPARARLDALLRSRKKETPVDPAEPTGEDKPGIGG
ncbi:MAG TPA: ribosome biogenesis GTP-binding protein YihA/YsxC [Steroidobacteraceae bacterium]|jgi:GTP-binding protein|nr:ribosome biogenesis GTP-binding protein YihA/YsxC [Steroidobacteraceae bacterium]